MRVLVTETMDPDGAMFQWFSPDVAALGHTVLTFPSQEALPLLGPDGLRAALLAVARAFQPTLVLVHPPYDHLDLATLEALGDTGAAVVAFAFDEPLFAATRQRPAVRPHFEAAARAFDRYAVTDSAAAVTLRQASVDARVVRFAASPDPFYETAIIPIDVRTHLVLVGRAYPKRVELVRAIGEHLPIDVFGSGWVDDDFGPNVRLFGPLTRPQMNTAYRYAGAVVTTGDWEDVAVPMVKYRLLEVAFAGGVQLAQSCPDLATYFRPDEVCVWSDVTTLVDLAKRLLARPSLQRAMAQKAHARALAEHRWKTRFGELVKDLPLARDDGGDDTPPAWCTLIAMLAHDAERRGATRLALALFSAWHERAPNATAAAGLARLALADHRPPPPFTDRARPGAGAGLFSVLPAPAIGRGMGHVGYLDPTPERTAIELAALIEARHFDAARALLDSERMADPDFVVAVAAVLEPSGPAEATPIWHALFRKALLAVPTQRLDLKASHRASWLAYAEANAPKPHDEAAIKKDGSTSPHVPKPDRERMQ